MKTTDGRLFRRSTLSVTGLALVGLAMLGSRPLMAQQAARPLGLETLARRAIDGNRDLAAAREGLVNAQEQVREAWGSVYPTIDLNASYSRNISPNVNFLPAIFFDPNAGPDDYIPIRFGADNTWNSTISFEQPLFRPGVFVAVGAAGRFESYQTEVVRGRSQSVVTQVRVSYYQLLLAQEQVRLTQNSLDRVQESLKETTALNQAGLASEYDVLRLQVELANLEPNLRRAENSVLQARRQLAIQADVADQESLRVSGTLAEIDLDDLSANSPDNRAILEFMGFQDTGLESMDAALASASARRSDVKQLQLNEELAQAQLRVQQMDYLPELTLFGNYIINAQDNGAPNFFAAGDGQRAYSRIVGLRLSFPIFQGFQRDARIDERRASLRQAQVQSRQGIDMAESQVRTLVENADEALQRAKAQKLGVTQAQRGFEIASAQYREGLGSQLELTDAEVALRQSEFNYAQAVYDYLVARAQLDEATGNVPLVDVDIDADAS